MNRITRLLAVGGIGLTAGIAAGAGPAQAATAAGQDGTHRHATQVTSHWDDDDDTDLVGYYSSLRRCERVGRIGEFRDRWEDFDCLRVRYGVHRGDWALVVSDDDDDDRDGPFRPHRHFPGRPFGPGFGGGPRA